jgi:aconitate hydratase
MTSRVSRTIGTFEANGRTYRYFSLASAEREGLARVTGLPYSLKVLLENQLRHHHQGRTVTIDDIAALGRWIERRTGGEEIAYHPARIIMPDSSGIPLLADLAAMRDAMIDLGGDAKRINPLSQIDLVVDHSVIVDVQGRPDALERNVALEYQRNGERYKFLRWAQQAFSNLRIVPPGHGIIHQINLEYLAQCVITEGEEGLAFPDTVLGMDSHTPMINALGILGWGCGGLEAGAAMLGQPVTMSIPEVIGVRFIGALQAGVTSTDLVLTVTERLRRKGVVQKFVEYCGPGLANLSMPTRATIANMAPEYGATVGFFPIDEETIAYLRQTGRSNEHVNLVEAYAQAQGLWRSDEAEPVFTDLIGIDLAAIEPSIAGPRRPQDRVALTTAKQSLDAALARPEAKRRDERFAVEGESYTLGDGDIALAAITSCTNTSNPQVIIGAALLARNAVRRGLRTKPWVKTSFSPGSQVVADYLQRSGLEAPLDALGFQVVGYGCMTCMGNSGPLQDNIATTIEQHGLTLAAVLSGNRNFEGRIHPNCRISYLASPPLVVAYALAGTMAIDLTSEPLGEDETGTPVYLRDIWPAEDEINAVIGAVITPDLYRERYAEVFAGDARWRDLPVRGGATFTWKNESWYLRRPPFFSKVGREPRFPDDIAGARALAIFGDQITTDHISPIGAIGPKSAAGEYLSSNGIAPRDFNSFGSRRVNHDVMIRGTFANARIRNELADGREGGFTRHVPDGRIMTIYDAAMQYRRDGVPLVVVAGADYGAGSSRDWAAKGTKLLGVRAIIAEGFERIHRSNLIGMGILPLQFRPGESRMSHRLDGSETYDLNGIADLMPGSDVSCVIHRQDGSTDPIGLVCRIDTAYELEYFRHGGILQFMLRRMLQAA